MSVVNETHTYTNTTEQAKQNTKTGIIPSDADSLIGGIVCVPNFRIYSVKLLFKGVEIAFYFCLRHGVSTFSKRLMLLLADDIF